MKAIISYFQKYPYVTVVIALAFVWMLVNIIQANQVSEELAKVGKYTLAEIKEIKGAKSGRWVVVDFEYEGKRYTAEAKNESIPRSWVGEKMFIKFLPSAPQEVLFLDSVAVPDSILNSLPTTWDSLP